ncbi:hypothetical protein [Variovorax sp. dw_308]|uniref:hypothetical protein n=1 Tax=Variovorax sp. dw_308 TaxID=2721546 RepID=UPI001C46E34C|nr:hypothetical protein [Variovorax sp. dw_308]
MDHDLNNPSWHHVTRIAWLSGGLVAISQPGPLVKIFAGVGSRVLLGQFNLRAYPELVGALRHVGYTVVGMTFITTADEASGLASPQFFAQSFEGEWRAKDAQQNWRRIAFHAGQKDMMLLSDVAARIASGLSSGQTRLQHLCHAYAVQLRSQVRALPIKTHSRFKDTNSPAVYLAIHAMFWELAVLRDTLAEFAARFVFGLAGISAMRGLVGNLKKRDVANALQVELLDASNEDNRGWLSLFSAYRNLFTHGAPLQAVVGVSFAVLDNEVLRDGTTVPTIYYPLPADAAHLSRKRSAGPLHETFAELISSVTKEPPNRDVEPDALSYLAVTFDRLVGLAQKMLPSSPVPADDIVLTEADIIGEVTVSDGS